MNNKIKTKRVYSVVDTVIMCQTSKKEQTSPSAPAENLSSAGYDAACKMWRLASFFPN